MQPRHPGWWCSTATATPPSELLQLSSWGYLVCPAVDTALLWLLSSFGYKGSPKSMAIWAVVIGILVGIPRMPSVVTPALRSSLTARLCCAWCGDICCSRIPTEMGMTGVAKPRGPPLPGDPWQLNDYPRGKWVHQTNFLVCFESDRIATACVTVGSCAELLCHLAQVLPPDGHHALAAEAADLDAMSTYTASGGANSGDVHGVITRPSRRRALRAALGLDDCAARSML